MKISRNWLATHLDGAPEAAELSGLLAKLGFETAGIERRGPNFHGVVVGKVLSREKHPNADKLSVCVVDDGAGRWNVVCGAPNVAAGQAVAFARVGARLPGSFQIGKAKLRGIESQGMICSREELGLPKNGEGIWVLDPTAAPGADVSSLLGPPDDVLDVEITPNRPDCLSHRGLARELSALLNRTLKASSAPSLNEVPGAVFSVSVEDPAGCPFYSARLIEGVKVSDSPAWLKNRLESIGLKPINNIVDATNFILHDIGQPLHAFDADKIAGSKIMVRRAKAKEPFVALDGKTYALAEGSLVIADEKSPLALAGVMGGAASGVTAATTRILLESACFAPAEVRRSSQSARLRSDSSYRFERGVASGLAGSAATSAAALIVELAGGRAGKLEQAAAPCVFRSPIQTSAARLNEILGTSFPEAEILGALRPIAADLKIYGGKFSFAAPSWRRDLETAWDLAEEVGRFLGYDRIPYKLSPLAPRPASLTPNERSLSAARRRLSALGLCEACNYDLLSQKALASIGLSTENLPRVANPISEDWAFLRPSLIPGLLKNAQYNLSRGAEAIRLFELGKAYAQGKNGVSELWRGAGLLLGPVSEARWKSGRASPAEFADVKAVIEDLLDGIGTISWARLDEAAPSACDPLLHPANSRRALVDGKPLAVLGQLHPRAARAHDLDPTQTLVFELDLEALSTTKKPKTQVKPFSPFPPVRRDLAFVVKNSVAYAEAELLIRQNAGENLQNVELFDVYKGKGIPEGSKSLAVRLTFGRSDRTLTDGEVAKAVNENILPALAKFGAKPRV